MDDEHAAKGKNFFDANVFERAKKDRGGKSDVPEWFYDTLRSQHIPYNFFVPLDDNRELAKQVFNKLFELKTQQVEDILIEYPQTNLNPLGDRTSFDVFVEYRNQNDKLGLIGIEVKYTEGGYSPTDTERKLIADTNSVYYTVTQDSKMYEHSKIHRLKENTYRQIWRNHLLAFAFANEEGYDEFLSVTLYHEGNTHFEKAFQKYDEFVTDKGRKTLESLTFSEFCKAVSSCTLDNRQQKWNKYLIERYDLEND